MKKIALVFVLLLTGCIAEQQAKYVSEQQSCEAFKQEVAKAECLNASDMKWIATIAPGSQQHMQALANYRLSLAKKVDAGKLSREKYYLIMHEEFAKLTNSAQAQRAIQAQQNTAMLGYSSQLLQMSQPHYMGSPMVTCTSTGIFTNCR